jgi:hypothetical protein
MRVVAIGDKSFAPQAQFFDITICTAMPSAACQRSTMMNSLAQNQPAMMLQGELCGDSSPE